MSLYPERVARCQHIRVDGTQCGSPALRSEKHCYYHVRWYRQSMEVHLNVAAKIEGTGTISLPTLEDANSVQVGLAELMRLLAANQIDYRRAALMLYALQTAAVNVKRTSFEPEPTRVVIDQECVEQRPIGATAWSTVEGCEYDDVAPREIAERVVAPEEEGEATFDSMLSALVARAAQNSGNSNQRRGPARAFEKK